MTDLERVRDNIWCECIVPNGPKCEGHKACDRLEAELAQVREACNAEMKASLGYQAELARGCWPWPGAKTSEGYGTRWHEGHTQLVHRVTYEVFKGPIPEGFTIDHLCRNRGCVNPEHLEAVSNHENILRGEGLAAKNSRKTHCPQGHLYDEENTLTVDGKRHCRECSRERTREWRKAKRKAAP